VVSKYLPDVDLVVTEAIFFIVVNGIDVAAGAMAVVGVFVTTTVV